MCRGPAPARSRDSLRMNGVGERETKGEKKRLIFLGLHRKANKAPDMGLALFMEATGALSME